MVNKNKLLEFQPPYFNPWYSRQTPEHVFGRITMIDYERSGLCVIQVKIVRQELLYQVNVI